MTQAQESRTPPNPVTEPSAVAPGERAGLRDFVRVLVKRKLWIVASVIVIVGATAVWTIRQTKIYRATASVVVEETPPQVLGRDVESVVELGSSDYWSSQEYLMTQLQLVRSKSLCQTVVRRLGLNRDQNFAGPAGMSVSAAADRLSGSIAAEMAKSTRIMLISVSDPNPKTAQVLANAVVDAYIQQNLERKLSSTVEAVEWLTQQLGGIRGDLERSERALTQFKTDNNVLSLDLDDRQNVIANQITKLTEELTATKTRRIQLAARGRELESLRGRDPLNLPGPPILESALVSQLKSTYAELRVEEADLTTRYGAQHPKVLAVTQRLRSTREDIEREVNNLLEGLRAESSIQVETERNVGAELARATQEALELNTKERDYRWLEREKNNNEKLYGMIVQRTRETDLTRALHANNIRRLDAAVMPRAASSPRFALNVVVAGFLSLLVGLGLAFLADQLDNTIKGQGDVEQRLGLTFLGLIPAIEGAGRKKVKRSAPPTSGHRDLFVRANPKSQVAECCRSLRTSLSFISPDKPIRSLLVTSSAPQDGKTTAAVSLGIVMAEGGLRVLIVDTDMRRPRLHRVFGVSSEVGISNLLVGDDVALEDATKSTEIPGLSVIPCGPTPPNPAELLQSRRFRELLSELTSRYDRVILDSPPVVAVTDPAIIGAIADGTLLIARAGQTKLEMGLHAVRQLTDVGANLLGMVLNDVDLSFSGYAYYQYRYGYYYGETPRSGDAVASE